MSAPQPVAEEQGQSKTMTTTPPPWHAAYPAPRNPQPTAIAREEVLAMLQAQLVNKPSSSSARDFLLVDLRRVDHEV